MGFAVKFNFLFFQVTVQVGDKLGKGQTIGYAGNTGYSTGSHLHYPLCFFNSMRNVVPLFISDLSTKILPR